MTRRVRGEQEGRVTGRSMTGQVLRRLSVVPSRLGVPSVGHTPVHSGYSGPRVAHLTLSYRVGKEYPSHLPPLHTGK